MKFLIYTIGIVAICLGLFFGGKLYIGTMIDKRNTETGKIIRNILVEQSNSDVLPDLIVLNLDSTSNRRINDSIRKDLAAFLTGKYLKKEPTANRKFDIQPYITLTGENDKLHKEDIIQLKKHIEFLALTVDKAVEESKNNIDTEIARVNNWITIWIGVFGFLGIFIPIVVNYKSLEDLREIKQQANDAYENAKNAKKILDDNEDNLSKLPDLLPQVSALSTRIDGINTTADTAHQNAEKSIKESETNTKIMHTITAMSKLKDIDTSSLLYHKQPVKALIAHLETLYNQLQNCTAIYNHVLVIGCVSDLARKLHTISVSGFINRENMTLLNEFADLVNKKIEQGSNVTELSYGEILSELHTLIGKLKAKTVATSAGTE